MTRSRTLLALLVSSTALIAGSAWAQSIAIINARLETATRAGTIPNGTIVMVDGKITAIGANLAPPAGTTVIDAKGGVVTPGFIAASSSLGVAEIEQVGETRGDRSGRLTAGFDIQYGVNPASPLIPLARQNGLTRAVVTPLLSGARDGHQDDSGQQEFAGGGGGGGDGDPALFGGQAAVISLSAAGTDPVIRAKIAVALDLGEAGARNAGGSRGAAMVLVKSALEDTRRYMRNRAVFERGAEVPYGLSRIDLEALVPVVEGRVPLLVRVESVADIRQVLRLAREEKLKLVLEGVTEGWLIASEIAAAGVPVLVDPQADLPNAFESRASRLDNAARLNAAGVKVGLLGSRDYNNLRQVRFNAGLAVAQGLPYAAALAGVTSNVAAIWGMPDVGSLEIGKTADVVMWNGDPFETSSWPLKVFIKGVEQPDTSRAFELRDRYAAAPSSAYPSAYPPMPKSR